MKMTINKTLSLLFLAGAMFFYSCSSKEKEVKEKEIPRLPSYNAKDYEFKGERIEDTYLQFIRDVKYKEAYVQKLIRKADGGLEKTFGTEKLLGRVSLDKNVNVLIERKLDGIEIRYYDDKGAGENNDKGDLWPDYFEITNKNGQTKKINKNRKLQIKYAENLITIYNHKKFSGDSKQSMRDKLDKIKTKMGKKQRDEDESNYTPATKSFWEKLKRFK